MTLSLFIDAVASAGVLIKGISDLRATAARPFEWIGKPPFDANPSDLVLFRNGLLDLRSGKLHDFDGSYFATGLPEHAYDPSARCPTWMAWLDQALDQSYHPTLQEWMGYLMATDVRAHRFMNLIGVKRGGKSTAAHICKALVGKQHSHSSALSGLGESFGLEPCLDKRLLIVPDAHDVSGSGRTLALERIKMITGGDEVDVNRKNLSVLQVPLPTRLMLVANKMPKFIDESGALAARMLIVRFDTSFLGREDRSLGERLMAEMPGIANWALEADALGGDADLPFLSDKARVAAAKSALAADDWDTAEAASARGVISSSDGDAVQVTFVAPPDWARFGDALWAKVGGAAHAVFHSSVMLVDEVAVTDCVGLPFEDDAARRDCAAWCLRNGLDDLARNVSRTPVGGEGPFCTWPDADIDAAKVDHAEPRQAETQTTEPEVTEADNGLPDAPDDASEQTETRATGLFGAVVCPLDL